MARLKDLPTPILQDRLSSYRVEPEDNILYELQVHEIELELQNRELIETQRSVEISRDRYAKLYDFAPIGYAMLNRRGIIKSINLLGADMFRRPRTHLIGYPMVSFIAESGRRTWLNHILRWRDHNRSEGEFEISDGGGGKLPVHVLSVNVGPDIASLDLEDQFLVAIIDVGDRKRAETRLKQAHGELDQRVRQRTAELEIANTALQIEVARREQLEIALRNRADELNQADRRKDEFLAMLSHELRNPLAALRTGFELLKRRPETDGTVAPLHRMLDRQFNQLVRLIDDLLDVSRINSGKIRLQFETVDLRKSVEDALGTARGPLEQRGHALSLAMPPQPLWIRADAARIQQIVLNLVINAIKFTDAGGQIQVTLSAEGGEAVLCVADNGQGIAEDLLPHIFEVFVQGEKTLDRHRGGLGLGLAVVGRLVDLHGGQVEAFSAGPGSGSRFTVRLPAQTDAEPGDCVVPNQPGKPVQGQCRRIMLVDDNADFTESTAVLLRSWDYEVQVADDGHMALKLACEFAPELVFIDIGLPGMDGFALASALRKLAQTRGAHLVVLSGYGSEEHRARAHDAGVNDYLTKPVTPETLEASLGIWLHCLEQATAEKSGANPLSPK